MARIVKCQSIPQVLAVLRQIPKDCPPSEIETTQILGGAPGPIVVYSESKAESQPAAEGTPRPYCWVIEWENGKQDFVDGDPDLCNSKSVSKPLYEAHIALVEVLPCKHPFSLLVKSVESNYSFCELCEMRKMRDDAEEMERVNLQRAEAAESRLSALEADAQNMVPRSRYDACNSDWLAAKSEVEKKQALLTQVGKWIEQYPTTREVIDAMSRDCAARAERKEQSNGQG